MIFHYFQKSEKIKVAFRKFSFSYQYLIYFKVVRLILIKTETRNIFTVTDLGLLPR